ncbi:MAG: DUF4416 family protein [Calditrichaeota bacterium]|nr:MAG: DUF4416 family protein [Calditrichota bacterium]
MAEPSQVALVKLLVAALYVDPEKLGQAAEILEEKFGSIDYKSESYPFHAADYYEPEMGAPIKRILFSFVNHVDAANLAEIKLITNSIENTMAISGKRTVNLDSGYLDFDKLVLASMKKDGQKIYIGKGVWADMNLMYAKGQFTPFEWTFPDFAQGIYDKPLLRIREIYKAQLRESRSRHA